MALLFRPYFEGGIERLIKNDILPPLEFSDLEQCREYIKGKYVKKLRKMSNEAHEFYRLFIQTSVVRFL